MTISEGYSSTILLDIMEACNAGSVLEDRCKLQPDLDSGRQN